jgi:ABC-2 type transport system permease protein
MRNLLTVFRRELAAYFNSAIAYIFIIVFLLLNGSLFMNQFFVVARADMRPFFNSLPFLLAIFLPAVTMRMWAEERKGNTMELLLTFPMAPHELVLGKYLASFVFFLASLAGTLIIPAMLHFLGNPDMGAIFAAYMGVVLIGGFYLAVGLFISGLARDQIVAFILAMMICLTLQLVGTEFIAAPLDGWISGLGTFLRNFVGTTRHYESFSKGVIDNRDMLYFILGSAVFLILNGFWLEGRMRPKAKRIFATATLISIAIFLTANALAGTIPLGRFDLTNGQIYTISPATKKILGELKAPVNAKFYVSPVDKMPTGMKTLEQEVTDKLDEFRVASKGLFEFKIFHMEAANVVEGQAKGGADSLEEELSGKGIQPFQVQSIEADEVGLKLVYSTISLAYKEKPEEIIPRVIPDNIYELEYLLLSRIYRMTLSEAPKIALVAPYEDKELGPEMQALMAQLGGDVPEQYREDNFELLPRALQYAGYEVVRIKLSEEEPIPDGTTTLVIVEPNQLNERQKYEINRFLRTGGAVFLAVQNYMYQYSAAGRDLKIQAEEKRPNVNSLLTHWGLEVDEQILVDEQNDVVNLSGAARLGPYELSVPVKVPIQIIVAQAGMNPDISITSRLSTLFYLWGTSIKINEEKVRSQDLKVTPLLYSSSKSWTVPFKSGSLNPQDLNPKPESDRRSPFLLAAMIQGQFGDAFEGKSVPAWPKLEAAVAEKAEETIPQKEIVPSPGKLILIGASTLFQKNLLRNGGHLNFFLNSVDAVTLGEELVTVRSKQPIDRTIGRLNPATKVIWRFLVTLMLPIGLALIGTFRMILRRQSKSNYLKVLSIATS